MGDIILDRSEQSHMMNLNEDEMALLDDIEVDQQRIIDVSAPRRPAVPAPRRRPPPSARARPAMMDEDDDEPEMDAFINQSKRTAPSGPPPEVEDYGEEEEDEGDYPQAEYQGGGGGGMNSEEQPSEGYASIDDELLFTHHNLSFPVEFVGYTHCSIVPLPPNAQSELDPTVI